MNRDSLYKQLHRAGSVLLLLFSLWCYTIYADVNWKDTVSFAQDCVKLLFIDPAQQNGP